MYILSTAFLLPCVLESKSKTRIFFLSFLILLPWCLLVSKVEIIGDVAHTLGHFGRLEQSPAADSSVLPLHAQRCPRALSYV